MPTLGTRNSPGVNWLVVWRCWSAWIWSFQQLLTGSCLQGLSPWLFLGCLYILVSSQSYLELASSCLDLHNVSWSWLPVSWSWDRVAWTCYWVAWSLFTMFSYLELLPAVTVILRGGRPDCLRLLLRAKWTYSRWNQKESLETIKTQRPLHSAWPLDTSD